MTENNELRAVALVCTLNATPTESSSDRLAREFLAAFGEHGVTGEVVRVVDHDVKPGVLVNMGEGDEWPEIRAKILAADILIVSTPTWLGQHSSVCQRVLERLDGELSEQDDSGRLYTNGKVAVAAVVGNEDGAHHVSAVLFQALNDVGFTIPAQGVNYWNDERGRYRNYTDLDETPETVASTTKTLAGNAVHLARLLKASNYPPPPS